MKTYQEYLTTLEEFGVVEEVAYPIITIKGLPGVKPHEIVLFESGEFGEVYAMNADSVIALLFSLESVHVGTKVVRTNKTVTVGLSEALLGMIITPLGQPFSMAGKAPEITEEREVDIRPPDISQRARIQKPFITGSTIVDMMVPIGKGQKELIIGDRKTGKSSFLLTTLKNHVLQGHIAIYAVIGKRKSDIKQLQEFVIREKLEKNIVIVAANANDSLSLIYLTPFTAMTIAEYFRDAGREVLIVLDDLTTHAKVYREISLLAKNFPGRDSYPGDIFYTHARLLERAGNFLHPNKGEVSITCLPIVETVEGDFAGYIATNTMGITDGHIYFDSNIFYNGRRPAINTAISVTRVGKQTQSHAKRDINRELTSFFSLYEKMQNLSHFGAELTDNVKNILQTGEKLQRYFEQHYNVIVPEEVQIILFCLLWLNFILPDKKTIEMIRDAMIDANKKKETQQLFTDILHAGSLNETLKNVSLNKERLFALWKKDVG